MVCVYALDIYLHLHERESGIAIISTFTHVSLFTIFICGENSKAITTSIANNQGINFSKFPNFIKNNYSKYYICYFLFLI